MGRRSIELVKALVDQIHKGGYQHRALEDDIYAESQKRIAAEKDRDHWRQARQEAHEAGELMQAEIETLRKELANAQRELSEQSMVANVETQQDAAAWQQQVDSANAEVSYLRARLDEERSVSAGLRQQLRTAAGRVDLTEETNRSLRQQLNAAQADNVEIRKRLNDETDRHRATNSEKIELFQQKESANQHYAELVKERDAAQAAVTLQRAGIERLHKFVGKVRLAMWPEDIKSALAELDAGTEPTPVAEPTPCPECERLQAEIERLRRFVGGVEGAFGAFQSISPDTCCDQIARCLSELEDSPTPVAEHAEGGA